MSKFFWLITAFLITKGALACTCAPELPFKNKEDLKPYDFIALVQITKLSLISSNRWMRLRVNGNIGIHINELFKGDTASVVHDYSYNSDCAFEMKEGEEWLLYGNNNKGQIFISKCSFSRMYRDSTGKRDWAYFTGVERLDKLRQLFEHQIPKNTDAKICYPNGNVEIEQSFKDGQLTGIRKTYYPDGQLYVAEKFKDGKRIDFRKIYLMSGQLINQTTYKNNLIKQITGYQDTAEHAWYINFQIHHNKDPLFGDEKNGPGVYVKMLDSLRKLRNWDKQISRSRKFSANGRSYVFKSFDYKGDTSSVGYLDWDKRISEHVNYYRGKLQYTVKYDQRNDLQAEHDYDGKGGKRDFLKKCEACKFYFDEKSKPEATPEEVYF